MPPETLQTRSVSDAVFFQEQLARIPRRYSPVAHLCATTGVAVVALMIGFLAIGAFGAPELVVILFTVVIANLVEWCAHRELLHRRRRFWEVLYDQHTPRHHRFYRYGSMAVGSRREWYFVLMPAKAILGIAILGIPMALLIGLLFGPDPGWTSFMTTALYVVAYEVTHLCYHLPPGHPVQRSRIIRRLSRHHARHHDPELMRKWNLNVTLPLWDWIFRTIAPKKP